MKYLLEKPVLTVTETAFLSGLSNSTIKRKILSGELKAVDRDNLRNKILIHTASVKKFLNIQQER